MSEENSYIEVVRAILLNSAINSFIDRVSTVQLKVSGFHNTIPGTSLFQTREFSEWEIVSLSNVCR